MFQKITIVLHSIAFVLSLCYINVGGGNMTTTITTRVDCDDKVLFDAFCEAVGLSTSSAINMFIKATIREGEIPFKIKADPFFSDANQALLRKSMKEMEETGGTIHDIDLDV